MKKLLRIAVIALISFVAPLNAGAQKIAHLDMDSLYNIWPKYQKVKDSLTKVGLSYQKTLDAMEQEYSYKSNQLDSQRKYMTALNIKLAEKQLSDMQQNYAIYSQEAQTELAALQDALLKPLNAEAKKAVADVAKKNGYKYVLDSSEASDVLYSESTDDIFTLVMAQLKIPAPKPAVATGTGGGTVQPPPGGGH
ncbi:MAG: OmpH family outer membrane protein [Bacteroidetes bacterium]|nr:OmpH family outer membrane protein [Bacteroidota bacterium]